MSGNQNFWDKVKKQKFHALKKRRSSARKTAKQELQPGLKWNEDGTVVLAFSDGSIKQNKLKAAYGIDQIINYNSGKIDMVVVGKKEHLHRYLDTPAKINAAVTALSATGKGGAGAGSGFGSGPGDLDLLELGKLVDGLHAPVEENKSASSEGADPVSKQDNEVGSVSLRPKGIKDDEARRTLLEVRKEMEARLAELEKNPPAPGTRIRL